ncbi:MAG: hypothetical protein JW846_06785 [Dehalococcoidia bacterium]|nr:hypothetical protein [Dehalococcoidia bacterium]
MAYNVNETALHLAGAVLSGQQLPDDPQQAADRAAELYFAIVDALQDKANERMNKSVKGFGDM